MYFLSTKTRTVFKNVYSFIGCKLLQKSAFLIKSNYIKKKSNFAQKQLPIWG